MIAGPGGTRTVAADDFFVDLFETAIGEDEILTEIRIPKHTGWGACYEKFVRVAHQWPIVAVAAAVRLDGGTIAEARVGPDQHGLDAAAGARGRGGAGRGPATEEAVAAPPPRAADGTNPPSDLNGEATYRAHLATVLTRRAVLGRGRGLMRRGPDPSVHRPHRRSRRPGRTSRTSAPSPSASPARRSTLSTSRRLPGSVKVKLGPIALLYNGSGTFVEKDEAAHRFVVDAKGKDKRGNGTAGAKVTLSMADAAGIDRRRGRSPTWPSPASRRSSAAG